MINKKNKQLLIELADNKCEQCDETENLEIHRIRRGYQGGTYNWRNCMVLCHKHHKMIHGNEFK
jgi:hypothetical protein